MTFFPLLLIFLCFGQYFECWNRLLATLKMESFKSKFGYFKDSKDKNIEVGKEFIKKGKK